ncbi:MAG: hypothetical protein J6A97_04795 [Clostridia bacterium]|nr:hypothetical protein [Clostridia bacterium]
MKKKVLIFIFIFCVIFSVGSIIYDKIADNELTFEEKVLEIMNYDEFSGTQNVDDIVLITEVDGGYFCVGTASVEETAHFVFVKEENGKLEFGGKSFSSLPMIVNNEDPTSFLRTSILNFSEKDYYYGCYQHKHDVHLIINGADAKIQSFNLRYNNKDYTMDFWLVCSENEPIVTLEE